MTAAQLRGEAARLRARATALVDAAARLQAVAASIRDLMAGVSDVSRRVWQGPVASDFEARADDADRELKRQADTLVATAGEFRIEAASLRDRAAALERQADEQEAAASATVGLPPGVRVR